MKIRKVTLISLFFLGLILIFGLSSYVSGQQALTPEQEAALRQQLQQIESEIADQQNILNSKQNEGVSISRDIAILDAKIKQAQLKIQAHNISIAKLGKDITIKSQNITSLSSRLERSQAAIADILKKTSQADDFSIAEALLAQKNLSEFFQDFDAFESLQASLKTYIDDVSLAKKETETEKEQLNQKRDQEIDTKVNVEAEQAKIKKSEADKQYLLSLNKQQQKNYQGVISEKQKKASAIRDALFALRDSPDIKFGDALSYAKAASAITGVRPAFVLAIITQESNLGKNVGACYLSDATTGAGVKVSSGVSVKGVMKPTRDVAPFLKITEALGRDPYKTRVSCPLSIGYGGAMGPAQFIPSTWIINADRIAKAVGKTASDPWNPRDAITASSIYLSDLGASAGGYSAEIKAACRYYGTGGSSCAYGTQVMAKATDIQQNKIDLLQN